MIVLTWVDGRNGLNNEHVMFTSFTEGDSTWAALRQIEQSTDRGYYSAPAISPNGTDVWLVYNAFLEPFKESAVGPENDRPLVGVVLHADVSGDDVGPFSEVHRGAPGDARGSSQNNLAAEFLGDYVYADATNADGVGVWNDVRAGEVCPAINQWRMDLRTEEDAGDPPNPIGACPARFGETDIWSFTTH